jgi:hypothetical protein
MARNAETMKRERGRPRRADGAVKFAVTLPHDLGEWGKDQPEGLSRLLSELLRVEHLRRVNPRDLEDTARLTALASERALSKIWDTPEEDAAWAHL